MAAGERAGAAAGGVAGGRSRQSEFRLPNETVAVTCRCASRLVHPSGSHNPFVIVFAEFHGMLRDVLGARGWRDRLGYLFRRPGPG